MVKRIKTKSTTRVHKTLHRNRKFEQHEIYYKSVVNSCVPGGQAVLSLLITPYVEKKCLNGDGEYSTNINKTNNHLSFQLLNRKKTDAMDIQVLARMRINVAACNRVMGYTIIQ